MSGDTEKIIEISLAKIESSKARKGTGKSGILHRNLLVNSLLNRVRTSDTVLPNKEPLMNYRESKIMVDLDVDDYDMDKIPSFKDCNRNVNQHPTILHNTTRKQSCLVSKLNFRSIAGKPDVQLQKTVISNDDMDTKEKKVQEIPCECLTLSLSCSACISPPKHSKKRLHSVDITEEDSPRKKLRSLWTPNLNAKNQETTFSITSLSSLFGNLVANTEPDVVSNMGLGSNFVSAMVAC